MSSDGIILYFPMTGSYYCFEYSFFLISSFELFIFKPISLKSLLEKRDYDTLLLFAFLVICFISLAKYLR
jgi:hypothetical protein